MKCTDCAEPIRDREPILHCFDCGGWCHVECVMVDEDTSDVRCEKCYWKHKRELRKDADNPPEEKKTLLSWDLEDEEKKAFAPPFGTIRQCRACGCLVAGGPTACARCAEEGA